MTYANLQASAGTPLTSGTPPLSITKQYPSNVTAGSLLVAVIFRYGTATPPTVGQVTDDKGNYWNQAVEYADTASNAGCELWYCESAGGGNKPTVTATLIGYPTNAISDMNIVVLEYSGNSGYQLVDGIGQATIITATTSTPTTSSSLTANHELAISAVSCNSSTTGATIPSGWTSRYNSTGPQQTIADNVDTGASSSGSTFGAAWTGLTGSGHKGAAIIATFVPIGSSSSTPHLLQTSYVNPPLGGSLTTARTSQAFPVNPTPGNMLVLIGNAQTITGGHATVPLIGVTDTAGNRWKWAGESLQDAGTAVDFYIWTCSNCVGGATTLTLTFPQPMETASFLLLEIAATGGATVVDSTGRSSFSSVASVSTAASVRAGDIAFAVYTAVFSNHLCSPTSGWRQVFSDTIGGTWMEMQPVTAAGVLTASWGITGEAAVDCLVTALRPAPSLGVH